MTDSLLFSPLRLNSVVVPNRVWLPAMVTWLSNDAGEVTDDVRPVPGDDDDTPR